VTEKVLGIDQKLQWTEVNKKDLEGYQWKQQHLK
jgi:hypothetical protein